MKINLKQISDNGLDLHQVISCQDIDLPDDVFTCLSPLSIHVHAERAGDEVLADCEVSGKYRLACSRCLSDFEIEKTDRFQLAIDIEPSVDVIDMTDDVREELIIAMPVNPICQSACKGLCPVCGENLNLDQCKCDTSNK